MGYKPEIFESETPKKHSMKKSATVRRMKKCGEYEKKCNGNRRTKKCGEEISVDFIAAPAQSEDTYSSYRIKRVSTETVLEYELTTDTDPPQKIHNG